MNLAVLLVMLYRLDFVTALVLPGSSGNFKKRVCALGITVWDSEGSFEVQTSKLHQ